MSRLIMFWSLTHSVIKFALIKVPFFHTLQFVFSECIHKGTIELMFSMELRSDLFFILLVWPLKRALVVTYGDPVAAVLVFHLNCSHSEPSSANVAFTELFQYIGFRWIKVFLYAHSNIPPSTNCRVHNTKKSFIPERGN